MSDFAARRVMMVDNQIRPSDVTKYPVIAAMLDIPRESFVPDHLIEAAYMGEDLVVAPRRVLLEPRTFAKLLDAVNIQSDELVLDVGSALGYSAAVIGKMAQAVVALEEDEALAAGAATRLASVDNVAAVTGALSAGCAAQAPYDVIVIEGGVEEIPAALPAQLKEGGRIAALFMESAVGVVRVGVKTGDGIAWRDAFNATAPVLADFSRRPEFAL
ncbi:protein-L-isoaspartate O-methyltransferase family protein [Falsigemmobacter faecalis]|uniref:Protein-L-isoaspartate O-methyltransferase n=1 Tax=Falsigemmobacter faecalis TaxID=2488730 RepID=A0A3P3DQ21_9RHOB|nr:protein-L-isoaspartate O-methyltransferase [Falsigemmobacter faecalis]RRH76305.1 protein-L-isoaspartate O-methyltransferase [Falsigemmobacter faecalis]